MDGSDTERRPQVQGFFHAPSNTISYLVWDPATLSGAIVDPVLDFDPASGTAGTRSVDAVLDRARELKLQIEWSLETHVHADHLSAAQRVRGETGARTVIGAAVTDVQREFAPRFGIALAGEGSEFDRLVVDGDRLPLGDLEISVIAVAGHTPADVAYSIGDAVFVGDSLFMPDYGTARCDFPGGSARQLYASVQRLLALPSQTRMFLCHDYKAPGRDFYAWETTVAQQGANVHIRGGGEEAFVAMREARDATLAVPAMLLAALQVNIRAGRVPRMLKLPVTWER
ncbi:glyoxylase-like metal-dependent hydrolase (beta-lactamase superfamily II) [Sphingomonas sp. F9_3S_D5_B_2]